MAVLPIRMFGDPVLTTPAPPVTDYDKELRRLVQDLTDTMKDAPGSGLAAPQIGVSTRVFTWYVDGCLGHLVNPTIDLSEDEEDGPEGCLSLPPLMFNCRRALSAVAKGFDMYGEPAQIAGTRTLARVLQHETDHLDGVLFIDRLDPAARLDAMTAIRTAQPAGAPPPAVRVSPHPTRGLAT